MFKFSLESVLSLKKNTEEMKKRELGLLNIEKEKLHKKKQQLEYQKVQLLHEMREHSINRLEVEALKNYNTYYPIIKKQEDQIIKEIAVMDQCIQEKKDELHEALKNRKILENLKAIQLEEYRQEEKRQEQQVVDEIVTYKYSQKDRGE